MELFRVSRGERPSPARAGIVGPVSAPKHFDTPNNDVKHSMVLFVTIVFQLSVN
jgi:hypothetical protein